MTMTSYVLSHLEKSHDCSSNQVLPARPVIMMVMLLNYSVTAYALKCRQPKTRNTTKLRIMIPALPEMAREHKTSGEMSCGSAKDTCPNAKGAPIRCRIGPLVYAKQEETLIPPLQPLSLVSELAPVPDNTTNVHLHHIATKR